MSITEEERRKDILLVDLTMLAFRTRSSFFSFFYSTLDST